MKTLSTSKAGLALAAAAAISMCVPTVVEAAPRHNRSQARHHHNDNGAATIGLVLGAVAVGAIIASDSRGRPVYAYPPHAYVEPVPFGIPHALPQGYHWFCPGPNDYYPNVTSCHMGWQIVTPPPPQGQPGSGG